MSIADKIKKYGLDQKDWFQHKHYTIITRMGIDKIQAYEKIKITFEAVKVEPEFCVVKATGVKETLTVESFGSSKYGGKTWNKDKNKWDEFGNTTTWYVMEMAEKRAMSRVVLKITEFYELGVFGEDESEDFKQVEERKPAFKEGGYAYLTSDKATQEHIQQALDTNRMTPQERKTLESKLK